MLSNSLKKKNLEIQKIIKAINSTTYQIKIRYHNSNRFHALLIVHLVCLKAPNNETKLEMQ